MPKSKKIIFLRNVFSKNGLQENAPKSTGNVKRRHMLQNDTKVCIVLQKCIILQERCIIMQESE